MTPLAASIDKDEIARFSAIAAEWWDPNGKFRPLHKFNPTRLTYIRETAVQHFGLDSAKVRPLEGLDLLDIGCGGGLLSEPMARLGASVVGADAGEANIKTASVHAAEQGLDIDYRATSAEALAEEGATFDIILNMEVIEHVADVPAFLGACSAMLKPGGIMLCATLNRSVKAFALAIVGAEYVLRWLPKGTHDWKKFITPAELFRGLEESGLNVLTETGVTYNPLADRWSLSRDMDVNYMMVATKLPGSP
ncbi:MAG: bifunctional 2-polyprenyl-6-hydroxyphenol methylase/3-demethylubiquinol 3-O-methyltransferase UbiG [Parvibaculaceae bacterium]